MVKYYLDVLILKILKIEGIFISKKSFKILAVTKTLKSSL